MEIIFGLLLSLQLFVGDLHSFTPEETSWRSNHNVPNSSFGFAWNYSLPARNFEYDLHFQLLHSTSSTNYTEFRLFSFESDTFLLRVGNAQDKLLLIRKNLSSEKVLISSIDGRSQVSSSNNIFRIRIRYQEQKIGLFSQINNETEFKTEGVFSIDLDHINIHQNAGIRVFQSTASFFGKHRFFWWKLNPIYPDLIGPKLRTYTYDKQFLTLVFDEEIKFDSLKIFVNQIPIIYDSLGKNSLIFKMDKIPPTWVNFKLNNLMDSLKNFSFIDTNLLIYFPKYSDLVINEIFPDPTPVYFMPNAEFLELKNCSAFPINLKDIFLNDDRSQYLLPNFELKPNDYALLFDQRDSLLFKSFRNLVPLEKWVSLTNSGKFLSLSSKYGDILDSVRYDWNWVKDNNKYAGGFSLERINSYANCLKPNENWQVCPLAWGATPGFENASEKSIKDSLAPRVIQVSVDYYKNVKIIFDEYLFSIDSIQINNTWVHDFYLKDNSLEFIHSETASSSWTIRLFGIKDCLGNINLLEHINYEFWLSEIPKRGDLIISEILADAFPVRRLPDTEYVEIYNKSDKFLYLGSLKFCRDNNCAVLPDFYLEPNSYAVLSDYFSASKFDTNVLVIPVINFPDLLSGGASIYLRNQNGVLLDKVVYHSSWYQDAFKKEGGYSLERLSIDNFCAKPFVESMDLMGGTPGRENSVSENSSNDFSREDPVIAYLINSRLAVLELNYPCYELNHDKIKLIPEESEPVKIMSDSNNLGRFFIFFDQDLDLDQKYELFIDSFYNCKGNLINHEFKLSYCRHPKVGELLINEILFNPKTGQNDYIELYNNSLDYINISGINIADAEDLFGPARNKVSINQNYCISPGSYVLLCEDFSKSINEYNNILKERIINIALVSMPDDQGIIQLYDSNFNLMDAFSYSEKMHHFLIKDREGKSLEKVNPNSISYSTDALWVSAATENNYGSPTRENSQFLSSGNSSNSILNVFPLGISPDNNGYRDFMEINIKSPAPDYYAKIEIINIMGQEIYDFGGVKLLGNGLKLIWEGQDKWGNRVNNGHYFIRVELVKGEEKMRETKTIAVGE